MNFLQKGRPLRCVLVAPGELTGLWQEIVKKSGFAVEATQSNPGDGTGRWRISTLENAQLRLVIKNIPDCPMPGYVSVSMSERPNQAFRLFQQRDMFRHLQNSFLAAGCLVCGEPVSCRAMYVLNEDEFEQAWRGAVAEMEQSGFKIQLRRQNRQRSYTGAFISGYDAWKNIFTLVGIETGLTMDAKTGTALRYVCLDYEKDYIWPAFAVREIGQILTKFGAKNVSYRL